MSQGLSYDHEHTDTNKPSPLPHRPLRHHDSNHPSSPLSPTPKSSLTHEPYVCTICRDTCELTLQTQIPLCHHSFCLSCLLSWTKVREICPNCKTSFTNLLVHRDLTGAIVSGPFTAQGIPPWVRESIVLLQRVEWVQTREVFSPIHDLESSFTLPPVSSSSSSSAVVASSSFSPAPHYLHEEFEDELESRFWEEEEKQFDRLMGSRVVSNRRFGANGYISAGRLRATPRPPPRSHKQAAASSAAGPSMAQSTRADEGSKRRERERKSGQANGSSSSGGRKKKLKKKSREGIAQAARKKAEAEAAAAAATAASTTNASVAAAASATIVAASAIASPAVAATAATARDSALAECSLSDTNASNDTTFNVEAGRASAASA